MLIVTLWSSLDLDCKLLHVLIVGNILLDRLLNDFGGFFAIFFDPFGILVFWSALFLFLRDVSVDLGASLRHGSLHESLP